MNIKGRLPILRDILYNIPVDVYDYSTDRWRKDKARQVKKGAVYCFEFAKMGNTLGLFKRPKGKMFVFTTDSKSYQPMGLNLDEKNFFIPEYDMDSWRDLEMRKKENEIKPKTDAKNEAIKWVGMGIFAILLFIGITYFVTNAFTATQACVCNINGVDLTYCQQLIANKTITQTGGII